MFACPNKTNLKQHPLPLLWCLWAVTNQRQSDWVANCIGHAVAHVYAPVVEANSSSTPRFAEVIGDHWSCKWCTTSLSLDEEQTEQKEPIIKKHSLETKWLRLHQIWTLASRMGQMQLEYRQRWWTNGFLQKEKHTCKTSTATLQCQYLRLSLHQGISATLYYITLNPNWKETNHKTTGIVFYLEVCQVCNAAVVGLSMLRRLHIITLNKLFVHILWLRFRFTAYVISEIKLNIDKIKYIFNFTVKSNS